MGSVVSSASSVPSTAIKELSKQRVALLFGYCGFSYSGLQRNPDVISVEDKLEEALYKAELIMESNYRNFNKIGWNRCSRTDKGVHASANVVSCKLMIRPNDTFSTITERVNTFLPDDIRLFDIQRVTKTFNAQIRCDYRSYEYMLPAFALSPKLSTDPVEITPELIERVNVCLKHMQGTKSFHNFSPNMKASQANSKRYIRNIRCEKDTRLEGFPAVRIMIEGQSFLLNQIRKMVGLVIASFRYDLPPGPLFERAFATEKFNTPTAPATFLLLEEPHFEMSNRNAPVDRQIDFASNLTQRLEFTSKKIYPRMVEMERSEKVMQRWLAIVDEKQEADICGRKDPNAPAQNIEEETATNFEE